MCVAFYKELILKRVRVLLLLLLSVYTVGVSSYKIGHRKLTGSIGEYIPDAQDAEAEQDAEDVIANAKKGFKRFRYTEEE